MQEQLKLLEALQLIDCELQEFEDALTALPEKLNSLKDDVNRVGTLIEGERARLRDAENYKNSVENALQTEMDQIGKSKSKMQAVRNSKEYMAIQREFETTRKTTSDREEELTKLREAMAKVEERIKQHETELQALRSHVAEEEAETLSKIKALQDRVATQRIRRETMLSTIPVELLRKYEDIRRRRKGKAVVQIMRGVCTGCHMKVPPQLFNVLKTFSSVETCPNCQRIIYVEIPEESALS